MVANSITKARAEQRRLFTEEVCRAIANARLAATEGCEAFKQSRPDLLDSHGRVLAEKGSTLLLVHRPSHRLRTALKELDEIDRPEPRLGWALRSLPPNVGQAIIGQEAACRAAAKVLTERFPGEGDFYCKSRES
jgi:hypothetical protein